MGGHVFISYSQPDADSADELVAHLERHEVKCWIAPRDIAPSTDWAAEIIDAISTASSMVLVFSSHSNQSPQVRREVERAVHKQLSVLTLRLEPVLPSKSLEYFLSAQHWMDAFSPPRDAQYARLCAHLTARPADKLLGQSDGTIHDVATAAASVSAAPTYPYVSATGASGSAKAFSASELRYVERSLAGYIGPVAKHLVKLAASRAVGVDDLIANLATELDVESDRREFMQRCNIGWPSG